MFLIVTQNGTLAPGKPQVELRLLLICSIGFVRGRKQRGGAPNITSSELNGTLDPEKWLRTMSRCCCRRRGVSQCSNSHTHRDVTSHEHTRARSSCERYSVYVRVFSCVLWCSHAHPCVTLNNSRVGAWERDYRPKTCTENVFLRNRLLAIEPSSN